MGAEIGVAGSVVWFAGLRFPPLETVGYVRLSLRDMSPGIPLYVIQNAVKDLSHDRGQRFFTAFLVTRQGHAGPRQKIALWCHPSIFYLEPGTHN